MIRYRLSTSAPISGADFTFFAFSSISASGFKDQNEGFEVSASTMNSAGVGHGFCATSLADDLSLFNIIDSMGNRRSIKVPVLVSEFSLTVSLKNCMLLSDTDYVRSSGNSKFDSDAIVSTAFWKSFKSENTDSLVDP